jgi:hypothetical protein
MDAPKGRYRVVEKDGRLIVIDNQSGASVSSLPPPSAGRPGTSPPPVVAGGKGSFDGIADFLLTAAVEDWDAEGRAIIHWNPNIKPGWLYRWDAVLDQAQQRSLGRALLALFAAPPFGAMFFYSGGDWLRLLGLGLTGLPLAWGVFTILRLRWETAGQSAAGD